MRTSLPVRALDCDLHRVTRGLTRFVLLAWRAALTENWPEAADALAASLTIVQALYGPMSVEWAREASKLAEVLFIRYAG